MGLHCDFASPDTNPVTTGRPARETASVTLTGKPTDYEIRDYLKTENGEREVDIPVNVAKLLVEFIGDRKTGLLS
jgi:hypothetical protein